MLNLTLFLLQYSSLNQQLVSIPLHSIKSKFQVEKSTFSFGLYSAFRINPRTCDSHFYKSKFDHFLSSAVLLDSENFVKQIFNTTIDIYETSANFSNCLFYNCFSSQSPGGAIDLSYYDESHISISIDKCSFYNCSSDSQGGAVFCDCENASVTSSCFENCYSLYESGQALQIRTEILSYLYLVSATNCKGGDRSTIYSYGGSQSVLNINITNNELTSLYSAFTSEESDNLDIRFLDIVNNHGMSTVGLLDKNANLNYVNFINNTIDEDEDLAMILISCDIHIDNSAFVNCPTQLVEGIPDELFSISFSECYFNQPIEQYQFEYITADTNGAHYQKEVTTVQMAYFDSVACWTITDDTENSNPYLTLLFIPLFLFIVFVIFGIVIQVKHFYQLNNPPYEAA